MNSIGVTGSNGPGPCPSGHPGVPGAAGAPGDNEIIKKFSNRFIIKFMSTSRDPYNVDKIHYFITDKTDDSVYILDIIPEEYSIWNLLLEDKLTDIIINKRNDKIENLIGE
jgi:hypothetical protein